MLNNNYLNAVREIVRVLSIIRDYDDLALKGGTALNLFYDNLPRLSLDIDLVYLPVNSRDDAFMHIENTISDIKNAIEKKLALHVDKIDSSKKLIVRSQFNDIKIEPNLVIRGSIQSPILMELNKTAQNILETNTEMLCLQLSELAAGKIVAALDRQHPRDLFDINRLLQNGLNVQNEFILFYLLQSNRPMNELLNPNPKDIEEIFENQFVGLTEDEQDLQVLLKARDKLFTFIKTEIITEYSEFLIHFLESRGDLGQFTNSFEKYPGIQWKKQNLRKAGKSALIKEIDAIIKLSEEAD